MIGLMDCNNFFVSCERLFRPDLRKKPVLVLSSNDGCVVARSQEVKDLGVPMGIPFFEVKDQCVKEQIQVFSSNFALYRDVSSRVMTALREECGSISVYSIDEAFFDSEDEPNQGAIALIRQRIMQKTGIPVSFGIARTKTIAKIANAEAKRTTGVCFLTTERFKEMAPQIPCGSIWGIGRETSSKLSALKIKTVQDILNVGLLFMRAQFGVHGERLFFELSGIPTSIHEDSDSIHASISSTRSFAKAIYDKEVLKSALGHHIAHVGEKLRERGVAARTLTIICAPSRHGDFALRKGSLHTLLVIPTSDTTTLLKEAFALLDRIYDPEIPYKKAGATVSGIIPESFVSGRLFTDLTEENKEGMYRTVDSINNRFGRGVLRSAVTLGQGNWQENRKLKSPEYTTQWTQLACVKAV